jgi:hypothetical protein
MDALERLVLESGQFQELSDAELELASGGASNTNVMSGCGCCSAPCMSKMFDPSSLKINQLIDPLPMLRTL